MRVRADGGMTPSLVSLYSSILTLNDRGGCIKDVSSLVRKVFFEPEQNTLQ